jgi:hypothetical protein
MSSFGVGMTDYSLFFFESARICKVRTIQADDDADAIEQARVIAGEKCAELWGDNRRIEVFNPTP